MFTPSVLVQGIMRRLVPDSFAVLLDETSASEMGKARTNRRNGTRTRESHRWLGCVQLGVIIRDFQLPLYKVNDALYSVPLVGIYKLTSLKEFIYGVGERFCGSPNNT